MKLIGDFWVFSAHQKPFWLACSHGHLDIAELLFATDATVIGQGAPTTPLWVAAHYGHLDCVEFLLNNLSAEQIDRAGPDGTTPLMQLLAAAKKGQQEEEIVKLITVYKFHFEIVKILEMAAYFGNTALFEILFNFDGCTEEEVKRLVGLAVLSDQVPIVQLILQKSAYLNSYAAEVGENHHSKKMREVLSVPRKISQLDDISQLIKMSVKFPKFNDCVESQIQPLGKDVKSIDIEKDVLPHLKKPFCPLSCYVQDSINRQVKKLASFYKMAYIR